MSIKSYFAGAIPPWINNLALSLQPVASAGAAVASGAAIVADAATHAAESAAAYVQDERRKRASSGGAGGADGAGAGGAGAGSAAGENGILMLCFDENDEKSDSPRAPVYRM